MPSVKSDSGSWQEYALDWDSRQRITFGPLTCFSSSAMRARSSSFVGSDIRGHSFPRFFDWRFFLVFDSTLFDAVQPRPFLSNRASTVSMLKNGPHASVSFLSRGSIARFMRDAQSSFEMVEGRAAIDPGSREPSETSKAVGTDSASDFRNEYGHTPLSAGEEIPWNCHSTLPDFTLDIASGADRFMRGLGLSAASSPSPFSTATARQWSGLATAGLFAAPPSRSDPGGEPHAQRSR